LKGEASTNSNPFTPPFRVLRKASLKNIALKKTFEKAGKNFLKVTKDE